MIARTLFSAAPGAGNGSIVLDPTHPYFIVTAVDGGFYYSGMNVQKLGVTTGWTSGVITGTCVDHQNGPWWSFYGTTCAYQANYGNAEGDSGGPVFTFPGAAGAVGDLVELGGVHFGSVSGASVFSKYSRIASNFGGTLVAIRLNSLGTPSVSGNIVGGSPRLAWSAIPGATKYQIIRGSSDGTTFRLDYVATTTSTSWEDVYTYALQYYGTTPLDTGLSAYYKIVAIGGATEVSAASTPVWYRTTLTCTGRC